MANRADAGTKSKSAIKRSALPMKLSSPPIYICNGVHNFSHGKCPGFLLIHTIHWETCTFRNSLSTWILLIRYRIHFSLHCSFSTEGIPCHNPLLCLDSIALNLLGGTSESVGSSIRAPIDSGRRPINHFYSLSPSTFSLFFAPIESASLENRSMCLGKTTGNDARSCSIPTIFRFLYSLVSQTTIAPN